jgi:hypothetical protein
VVQDGGCGVPLEGMLVVVLVMMVARHAFQAKKKSVLIFVSVVYI